MNIKIFLVQLAALVTKLHALGAQGDYSFEVFNDDYQPMPLPNQIRRFASSAERLA